MITTANPLEALYQQPGVQLAKSKHDGWEVFHRLLRSAEQAALAIANGWRLVSFDRDFERLEGLKRLLLQWFNHFGRDHQADWRWRQA
ncbi:MAG: hypothetical protein QE276_03185 [Cyanobium sp. D14.bin.5]|nr:hypothetical protein [Cyanobium sp. D14.bin.5]